MCSYLSVPKHALLTTLQYHREPNNIAFGNQNKSTVSRGIVSLSLEITIKGADWAAARSILRIEYKDNDLDQLMNPREFLEAPKIKSCSEEDDLLQYCQFFATISRDLLLRRRLDLYTRCQRFLQVLPEKIVMEIFSRYDTYLEEEDNGGLDSGDLLEKALVIVGRRKYLADFILHKETDPINKYTRPQENFSLPPPILPSLSHLRSRPPNSKLCKGLYKKI